MIGLLGAHRTGKTTLARAFAQKHEFAFVETSTTALCQKIGFDPAADNPFDRRMWAQEQILDMLEEHYIKAGIRFITDRTPLDALAYTMADVQGNTVRGDLQARFAAYMERCLKITNSHFTNLILIQPGLPIIDAPGKAPPNPAYIEHLNQIMFGLIQHEALQVPHWFIHRGKLDLEQRVAALEYCQIKVVRRHVEKVEAMKEQGYYFH